MNYYIKLFVSFIFVLFSAHSMAVTVNDAIIASENDDMATAVKIWSQLAKKGNPIAQYNMALYYSKGKGVAKNPEKAKQLLKNAARTGLVQPYLDLNKKAISPGNGDSLSFDVDPALWLSKQEPKRYTIQLASSRYEKSIKKSFTENNLKGKGGYYHYVRDGVDRYALIYGTYKTVAEAKAAMAELPKKLRKKTPWVRKIQSLQNISK